MDAAALRQELDDAQRLIGELVDEREQLREHVAQLLFLNRQYVQRLLIAQSACETISQQLQILRRIA